MLGGYGYDQMDMVFNTVDGMDVTVQFSRFAAQIRIEVALYSWRDEWFPILRCPDQVSIAAPKGHGGFSFSRAM